MVFMLLEKCCGILINKQVYRMPDGDRTA